MAALYTSIFSSSHNQDQDISTGIPITQPRTTRRRGSASHLFSRRHNPDFSESPDGFISSSPEDRMHSSFMARPYGRDGKEMYSSSKPRRPRKSFSGLDQAKSAAVARFRRASDSIKDRLHIFSEKLTAPISSTNSSPPPAPPPPSSWPAKSWGLTRAISNTRGDLSTANPQYLRPPHTATDMYGLRRQGTIDARSSFRAATSSGSASSRTDPLSAQRSVPLLRPWASTQRLSTSQPAYPYPFIPTFNSTQPPGAAARASAARENQRYQSMSGMSNSSSSINVAADGNNSRTHAMPKGLIRRDSNICLSDISVLDTESGIDIPTSICTTSPLGRLIYEPSVQKKDPFSTIPTELVIQILSNLDANSVLKAALVSKKWYQAAMDQEVWKDIFLAKFGNKSSCERTLPQPVGGLGIGKHYRGPQEWQRMYRARLSLDQNWKNGKATAIYLNGHADGVYCVQFDEDKIITGSRDQTIRVWDMHTFKCRKVIGHKNAIDVDRAESAPALNESLAATMSGLRIHELPASPIDPSIYHVPTYSHRASILCLQYDSKIMVTGSSDNSLIKWDIETFEPLQRLCQHTAGVLDLAFDERKIVSCSKDATMCIWDRETGILLQQLSGHRGPVNAVQLRGDLVVSASGEGAARLWNLNMCPSNDQSSLPSTSQELSRIPVVDAKKVKEFWSQDRGLACIEFSDDAQFVLAGGNDQSIYKFDTQSGGRIAELKGHTNLVRSLYLDGANDRIISGSYDMSLRVWDYSTGQPMAHFPDLTTSWMLSAKSDYRRILSTSQDGRTLILDFGWGVSDVELLE